ncbi:MAG: hypothetical protein ACI4QI_01930 [Candidatus Coproplasma sp.]
MNSSKEFLEKAKAAKTAEELLELAKAEGVEASEEEAAKAFAELHRSDELLDEELGNVSGGGRFLADSYYSSGDTPLFSVGEKVRYLRCTYQVWFNHPENAVIVDIDKDKNGKYEKSGLIFTEFTYTIRYDDGEIEEDVYESQLGKL